MLQIVNALYEDGKKVLSAYKVETLKEYCSMFCLKRTGKKSELVNRIWEYVNENRTKDRNEYIIGKKSVQQYIAENDIHVRLTAKCVLRLAGLEHRKSSDACNRLVSSYFKEAIFDDMCNDMFEYIMTCEYAYIQNGKLVFANADFARNNGFTGCYRSIEHTLSTYGDRTKKFTDDSHDFLSCYNEDGDEYEISDNNTRYVAELSSMMIGTEDCETYEYQHRFFTWMHTKYSEKTVIDCVHIVSGLMSGMNANMIKDRYSISKNTYTRRMAILRIAYDEYKIFCDDLKPINKPSATYGGYLKDAHVTGGFHYGDIFESELDKPIVINPVYEPLKPYESISDEYARTHKIKDTDNEYNESIRDTCRRILSRQNN